MKTVDAVGKDPLRSAFERNNTRFYIAGSDGTVTAYEEGGTEIALRPKAPEAVLVEES